MNQQLQRELAAARGENGPVVQATPQSAPSGGEATPLTASLRTADEVPSSLWSS